jgi:hypothetical protein
MRLNVTVYVHCRSCYILVLFFFTGQIIFNCFTWTLSNKLYCNTFRVGCNKNVHNKTYFNPRFIGLSNAKQDFLLIFKDDFNSHNL